jgi:histidine triad (HIT) family protein
VSDCIFCGIAAGTMPAERVYEDERTIAFLDIFPADDIHSLAPADLSAVAQTAQAMAGRVSGALGADGISIVQANGAAAGQTVFHYHVHVIPRFDGDGVLRPWTPGRAGADELGRMGALLRGE